MGLTWRRGSFSRLFKSVGMKGDGKYQHHTEVIFLFFSSSSDGRMIYLQRRKEKEKEKKGKEETEVGAKKLDLGPISALLSFLSRSSLRTVFFYFWGLYAYLPSPLTYISLISPLILSFLRVYTKHF